MRSETPSTTFNPPARMRRFVRGCDTRCAGFRLAVDDTVRSIRAEPLEGRQLVSATIFADGYSHRFPLDRVGAVVKLDDLTRLGTLAMTATETAMYSSVSRWMLSLTGTWLLTLSETGEVTRSTEIAEKVRVVDVDIEVTPALGLLLDIADLPHLRGYILTCPGAEAAPREAEIAARSRLNPADPISIIGGTRGAAEPAPASEDWRS